MRLPLGFGWPSALLLSTVLFTFTLSQDFSEYSDETASAASVSNHSPVLQVSASEGYLPETAEIGTTVRVSPSMHSESLQILVSDSDLKPGTPPATYQYILTGLGATIFAVDQRGFVYLNVPEIDADPPNPSTYQLNIQAREVDTVPIRSSDPVTITIHIMDINDNSPVFEQPIYTANTTANGGERDVVKVVASDIDAGKFGEVTYKIAQVTNNAEDNFHYNEDTNMLMAEGELTPGERYQIVIEAIDGGGRSSQSIVIVLALDPSGQTPLPLPGMETFTMAPQWAQKSTVPMTTNQQPSSEAEETIQTFVTEVTENTPPNTVVVSLGDSSNSYVYYNIVGGNEEEKFTINEQSGTISTVGDFDRERTAMYSLQIETRSRSPDQHLYWTLVQISVLDVNDNSPHFVGPQPIRLRLSIDDLDELSSNMLIGKVSVEDPDADDNGRLQLTIQAPMNRLFTVSNDGLISVNGDFTAEHFGEHKVFVIARDHGEPPRETRGEVAISIFGTLITMATKAPTTNEIADYTDEYENTDVTVAPMFTLFTTERADEETQGESEEYEETETTREGTDSTNTVWQTKQIETQTVPRTTVPQTFATLRHTETVPTTERRKTTTTTVRTTTTGRSTTAPTPPPPSSVSFSSYPTPRPAPATPTVSQTPLRLAPVFEPSVLTVTIDENDGDMEIAKVNAFYADGKPGTVTYVMQKGDPSLFSVSSFSGSVQLLRSLDAETDHQFIIQIGTAESSSLSIDPIQPHTMTLTVNVGDVNDWIPNFESSSYSFAVQEDTLPGTIVGQVTAFDQDRDEPNNLIRYRLVSAGGLEQYFSVNPDNGLITLARPVDAFADEKITLRIEASDAGDPPQSSMTTVLVDVESTSSMVIPDSNSFVNKPKDGQIQFSLRNYTSSVSESVRPPHLVQVLSVTNKPDDTRFIICNIVSGNYRGAFGVTAGNDGNCELRTQMELDRESVERYLLNVTVTAGSQTDYSLVSVTVLDTNDNVPRFVYDNDLGLSTYFAGVSSNAGAFTRLITVKAEDADLGNSSVVQYSLDPLSVHSKYFSISNFGEITTKQSMSQVLQKQRLAFFEIRVSACDSPVSGQQLCSKADVVINVITEGHRFRMVTSGLNPQQIRSHEKDIIRTLRQFTGACTLLNVEKMVENSMGNDHQPRTDVDWYAVNPTTRKICKKQEFRKLFDHQTVAMVAGKVQPWFKLEKIAEESGEETDRQNTMLTANWKNASLLLIILAIVIAIGAIIGICAICIFWSKYKVSQREIHAYPGGYPPTKMGMGTMGTMGNMGTIYLGNAPNNMDKIYETQMLELPISDEDMTMKSGSRNNTDARQNMGMNYRSYGHVPSQYEGDFSIEENMYAINVPGRMDPVTKRIQTLVIPAPDYDRASERNKSVL